MNVTSNFFSNIVAKINRTYSFAGDLLGLLTSLLIGLLAAFWPYYMDHRFYFNDDEQSQTYPYYLEIGKQLRLGNWPFLTLGTLNGGNIIIDWQYALFNPISLLSYWLIAPMHDLSEIGLVLASFYISLLSVGGYLLARSFGLGRMLSVVAGTVLCTNNFMIFVYSHSWMICLVASSWFLWAWSFIQFFRASGKVCHLVGAIIFSYLTLSAGSPQTIIMQGVLMACYLVEMILDSRCPRRRIVSFALSMAGVVMLVCPAFLPAIFSRAWTGRGMSFFSHGLFMANLGDFLNLSTFDLMPRMIVFNSNLCPIPIMYLAWFIVPLLPLVRWAYVTKAFFHQWALGLCGGVGLLLLFGPESTGPIRWPVRYLPLPQTVILICFLLIINKPEAFSITLRRCLVCSLIIVLSLISSISTFPEHLESHCFAACLLGFLTWIAIELIQAKAHRSFALWLMFGVLVGYVGAHYSFRNTFFPDFGSSPQIGTSAPSAKRIFDGYTLCMSGDFEPSQVDWSNEAFLGGQGLLTDKHTINGYTSVGHRTFKTKFQSGIRTDIVSPQAIANLFSTDATTGLPMIDLLRVNTLVIEKRTVLPTVLPYLDEAWRQTNTGLYTVQYERQNPNVTPDTLAWMTPGTTATPINKPTGENESFQVEATQTGSDLIFARLWWPGYAATLNGIPIVTKPFDDFLVEAQIAPLAHGTLLLSYRPPGYILGLILACLGVIIITVTLMFLERPHQTSHLTRSIIYFLSICCAICSVMR